ncbi:unnamed protein product [Rotaria sordida]|uniref:Cilia- and flagella-associated protein HOATZ n=1 Tax=Rotaria sordida TaxID=392033 RepID=A0A814S8I6_9BILA|nr:unnamed protein product [Rotaria sordida]CAF1125152.1 unnamed protein product [Rotaria sordida]CAF1143653.1 unnamed protein product [Rotaria sordida]CAF1193666.1 unnamed protein product [Rotaria sordida]CAF1345008.1 unnamed protein product [Rotaria sordida]
MKEWHNSYDRMNSPSSTVHEIDTRKSTALTVFDGSREDESKLAKQFWNSVVLIPPVESTLVCKEIKQRTRTQTLNDGTMKPRFSTTIAKTKNEKSMKDKMYDEVIAFQNVEDEAKQIKAIGKRHQQVRQLFCKQAKANRTKKEQWVIPQFNNYLINIHNQGTTMIFPTETDEKDFDDDERQLVCFLPD